jgi:hypothetical protein
VLPGFGISRGTAPVGSAWEATAAGTAWLCRRTPRLIRPDEHGAEPLGLITQRCRTEPDYSSRGASNRKQLGHYRTWPVLLGPPVCEADLWRPRRTGVDLRNRDLAALDPGQQRLDGVRRDGAGLGRHGSEGAREGAIEDGRKKSIHFRPRMVLDLRQSAESPIRSVELLHDASLYVQRRQGDGQLANRS